MAILRVDELQKSFGVRTLFSDISFEIASGDRVGLVGVNGCGKTTLFNILLGREKQDSGSVGYAKDCRPAYLEQTLPEDGASTLYSAVLNGNQHLLSVEKKLEEISDKIHMATTEELDRLIRRQAALQEDYEQNGGLTFRARTRSALLGLGFSDADLELKTVSLSGGQLRKAALARILLSDSNLLFLDEPTNHLDIPSVQWLENFLLAYRGAYVVISHDRYFLDRVTTRTIEIENGKLILSSGAYSRHIELKMDEREIALRHYYNTQKEIKRIEGIIEQQRRWNQARNYVTIASKEKQIERLKETLVKPETDPKKIAFHFHASEVSGNDVLICKQLGKSYGTHTLFSNADLHILKNERICVIGANGCGKTTFLKILTGKAMQDNGTYVIGANVKLGYYEQNMGSLPAEKTILQEMEDSFPRMDDPLLRNALALFLFRGDDVQKKIAGLSGGELARIQLLKLMLGNVNFLLLDEPTNHLDIASREALENSLLEYGGTMLIVTHDRYFINRIADRIFLLDETGFHPFSGDWDAYCDSILENTQTIKCEKDSMPQNDYLLNKERKAAIARARAVCAQTEKKIAVAEGELDEIQQEIQKPENAADYNVSAQLYRRMEQKKSEIDALYVDWERATSQLTSIDAGEL